MTSICTVGASTSAAVINEILTRDGCVVVEGLLSAKQVKTLDRELRPHFDETENCQGDFYGYVTKRLSGLIAKSSVQSMAIHPTILAVMDRYLLPSCRAYQLNLTQAIKIGPGEPPSIPMGRAVATAWRRSPRSRASPGLSLTDLITNGNLIVHS
jgi:hypothetical protein